MLTFSPRRVLRSVFGYSLIDLLATTAVVATVGAVAIPEVSKAVDGQRLGIDVRNVERELQTARLDAVKAEQPIRVRFNCPAAGMYRRVELIGTVDTPDPSDGDSAATVRCSTSAYPFPAADHDPLTRPNNDGPIERLNTQVSFLSVQTVEFRPNGTAFVESSPGTWTQIGSDITLSMNKGSSVKMIQVNGLGKIQIQ